MTISARLSGLVIASLALFAASARDGVAENSFDQAELKIVVGGSAGGGYDLYARLLARHIGRHIPGNPRVIVINKTGAGGLLVANELANIYPRDGSTIATPNRNIPTEPLFGNASARFDARQFNWIGSMNSEVSICGVWHTVPVNTASDLITRGMVVGGSSAGDDSVVFPRVLNALLGTKLKIVTGYPGGTDINIAIERGEIEGRCALSYSSLLSTRPDWVAQNKLRAVLQLASTPHPDLAGVPTIMDMVGAEKKDALRLIFARQRWGRPFLAPPGVPPERIAVLRKAFSETMQDADLLAEAEKSKMELEAINGDVLQEELAALYSLSQTTVELAKSAIKSDSK